VISRTGCFCFCGRGLSGLRVDTMAVLGSDPLGDCSGDPLRAALSPYPEIPAGVAQPCRHDDTAHHRHDGNLAFDPRRQPAHT
jgi:hypothetical protein